MSDDRRVLVGRIVGVHGVRGDLRIESWTEPRERIFGYQPWLLTQAGQEQQIDGALGHPHGKGLLAELPGIDDRDAASKLVGAEIRVPRRVLPDPPNGEYYWVDLEGLTVENLQGVVLGKVAKLLPTGANDVLMVRDQASGKERLLPYVPDRYVKQVDLAAGRMVVDWDPDY